MLCMGRGTSQRLVEGKLRQAFIAHRHDPASNAVHIGHHQRGRDSLHPQAMLGTPSVARFISDRLVATAMHLTVNLDD